MNELQRLTLLIAVSLAPVAGCGASTAPCADSTTPVAGTAPEPVAVAPAGPAPADRAPAPAPEPPAPDAYSFAEGQQQIVMRAAEITWGPCPPAIPFECEMAVLEGSPQKPGLFTARFRSKQSWVMPPHTHPRAERVTVLSGRVGVGFGTTVDKNAGQQFTTGDYYVNAAGAIHYVWADAPMEIQITGMGPWEVHPHEP